MDKIIPDDIINDSFCVNTNIEYKDGKLNYVITTSFLSVDDISYNIRIEHRRDSSIMHYHENEKKLKYYFSPYVSQRYLKFILLEYAKSNPSINQRDEVISFINKIKQHNLACKEVEDGES